VYEWKISILKLQTYVQILFVVKNLDKVKKYYVQPFFMITSSK